MVFDSIPIYTDHQQYWLIICFDLPACQMNMDMAFHNSVLYVGNTYLQGDTYQSCLFLTLLSYLKN